jgi:hypothetical protein
LVRVKNTITSILFIALLLNYESLFCGEQDSHLAVLEVREKSGLPRTLEYVICSLQLSTIENEDCELTIVAREKSKMKSIPCQVFNRQIFPKDSIMLIQVIFPIAIKANEKKEYVLNRTDRISPISTDLSYQGQGLDMIIENEFYQADLTKSDQSKAKSYHSGQLRELYMKMGFNLMLFRTKNRMHWAPNFQKAEYEGYETIAGWEDPKIYYLNTGPYLVQTMRRDQAPRHPEILLTANYYFYSGLPFFRFHSLMEIKENVWLSLLRNDEMTMDSLFTHVAFQRPDGQIEDLTFSERYVRLEEKPIENNATWLCFYHAEQGYAFGSIRLKYYNKNSQGFDSPTYLPHTKISDGAGGGKYWNRRLIHEYPIYVQNGSRYIEENAYLVFKIDPEDRFKAINYWAERLHHPLEVEVLY